MQKQVRFREKNLMCLENLVVDLGELIKASQKFPEGEASQKQQTSEAVRVFD